MRMSPPAGLALKARLFKSFPAPTGCILRDFELSVSHGEIVAVMGPSGCGKTTLLRLIAGLEGADAGSEVKCVESQIIWGPQPPILLDWLTVSDSVSFEARLLNDGDRSPQRFSNVMHTTALGQFAEMPVGVLSTGMAQRVQVCRLLTRTGSLALLDEPLTAIDPPRRATLALALRAHLRACGAGALWITHDISEARAVADRIVVLGGKPLRQLRSFVNSHVLTRHEPQDQALEDEIVGALRESLDPAIDEGDATRPSALNSGESNADLVPLALSLVLGLLAWEGLVWLWPSVKFFASAPSEWVPVFFRFLVDNTLRRHLLATLFEAAVAVALAVPSGLSLGALAGLWRDTNVVARAYLTGLTAVPLFVLAPIFILWFGVGTPMRVAVATATAVPVVGLVVLRSTMGTSSDYFRHLRISGVPSWRLLSYLSLPSAWWGLRKSLPAAAVAALIGAFLGEFISADHGLGYFVLLQSSRFRVGDAIAAVGWLFAIAFAAELVLKYLAMPRERRREQ